LYSRKKPLVPGRGCTIGGLGWSQEDQLGALAKIQTKKLGAVVYNGDEREQFT
jgi:hypothetical protein